MKYARNEVWLNSERLLAFLNEDGTVTFTEGATEEELREAIRLLLIDSEVKRQRRLEQIAESFKIAKRPLSSS